MGGGAVIWQVPDWDFGGGPAVWQVPDEEMSGAGRRQAGERGAHRATADQLLVWRRTPRSIGTAGTQSEEPITALAEANDQAEILQAFRPFSLPSLLTMKCSLGKLRKPKDVHKAHKSKFSRIT